MSETPGMDILRQVLHAGRIDEDEARGLCEHAPMLVQFLCTRLVSRVSPTPLTFAGFVRLAHAGRLTTDSLERALR